MTRPEIHPSGDTGPASRRPRQRRKEARPAEIIQAAIEIFGEFGFGAARMEDVARRAGVSKGTLFVYFSNKEDLFRSVAKTALTSHLEGLQRVAVDADRPFQDLVPLLLSQAVTVGGTRLPGMVRMLIAESRVFPDLARTWHDEVVSKVLTILTGMIERAQSRGEIRPGDARLYALSIVGPIVSTILLREVFRDILASPLDLEVMAKQHAELVLHGLLARD